MVSNTMIERLVSGEPVLAFGVRSARTAEIARIAKASGHDVIWVDLEHSSMSLDTAAQICASALDLGLVPLVRVPEREYGAIGRLLDSGAMGIISPRIETAEQAKDLVAACRFPPLGHRSAIATLPLVAYQTMSASSLFAAANRVTIVNVLIESPLGIVNLSEIVAVPGVDLVSIGTNDLCSKLGVPGEFKHPLVRDAHESALATCRHVNMPLAIGGVGDAAYTAELIRLGAVPYMMTGIDTDLLLGAARARVQSTLQSLQ